MSSNVLITGATGMIGSLIQQYCLSSDAVKSVVSLVRKPSGIEHPKLEEVIIDDFLNLDQRATYFEKTDIVYYCLGVYSGAVKRDMFRTITVEYPVALARVLVNKSPNLRFCLLSGAGADRSEKSRIMFAKDKGMIENQLAGMGFKAFHTFRPGYIYPVTPRLEPNFSYKLMRLLYPLIKILGKNSSIRSDQLAQAMFEVGFTGHGQEILENRDILEIL